MQKPPSELEVRPGTNVFSWGKVIVKIRVWREKEQRWYEVEK